MNCSNVACKGHTDICQALNKLPTPDIQEPHLEYEHLQANCVKKKTNLKPPGFDTIDLIYICIVKTNITLTCSRTQGRFTWTDDGQKSEGYFRMSNCTCWKQNGTNTVCRTHKWFKTEEKGKPPAGSNYLKASSVGFGHHRQL